MAIRVNLDVALARRKMSVNDVADAIGITPVNVSVLKNGRAKAIRFSTLDELCRVLQCQPGDILEYAEDDGEE
jgi:putative transcriptional regulator